MIQPANLLPKIDGFNCGIHAILNTYYLLFPNTDKDNVASDYCYEDLAAARYWLAYKLKNLKAFEHKRKKNSDFVKDEYIKDIPTLNLKDVKTTLGDNKMFTDIKSLITERNSQMPSQRRKMLNRLKDFDDNSEDDELNLAKQSLMNFKEKEKEETQKYSIESNSSYDETIKNLESTNFGIFIKSHTDFIQQMVSDIKFTIPEVNNSEQVRTFLKLPRNTFYKNATLDLDRVLSNFPEVEDFYPYIDIIHKFALVRERKVDWENLFGGIGTKERVPIKIKKQLMSNDDFIHYILLPELATKFYMEKDDITYKEASLKLYDNELPTLHHNDLMDQVFILDCV